MTHGKSWLRLLAAVVVAFANGASAQQLYGVYPFGNAVLTLDYNTGALTGTTPITVASQTVQRANGIAMDPTTGTVYAVAQVTAGRALITLDLATGAGTAIGLLGDNFASIAFRSDGQLFGVTGDGASQPETLYLVDKSNAATVLATTLGNGGSGEVIAYHPGDNAFYHWSGNGSIVFEKIAATAPYAVTPINTTSSGEISGAVWDAARGKFLVYNLSQQMDFWTPAGVRSNVQPPTGTYVRGMVLVLRPAVVSIVRAGANPSNAASVAFTVTFSQPVTGVNAADFALASTGTAAGSISAVSGSGPTWTVTVNAISGAGTLGVNLVDDDSIATLGIPLGGAGAGNGNFSAGEVYTVDRIAPAVTSVGVPASGTYITGQALDFTVNFGESVTVDTTGGTPALAVTVGATARAASYVSGSGTTALTFSHTVQAGDVDADGVAIGGSIALNGGTIRDAVGNSSLLALNSVGSTAAVLVNLFTVIPSAGANGTIAAATPQAIGSGATTAFTVTPNAGYAATVGGTCGGTLAGTTYTTNAITASCTVVASFAFVSVSSYSAPSPTGSGTITASFTGGGAGCSYATSQFIPVIGHARSPPMGSAPAVFAHGLFDFTLQGCTAGATVNFTVTYPAALAGGTRYWKYGPTAADAAPHWYVLPAVIAGNTAAFSIVDGGLGDDDLVANGNIVDQGGPGLPAGASAVPTLSQGMLMLLAGLLGVAGMYGVRTRRG